MKTFSSSEIIIQENPQSVLYMKHWPLRYNSQLIWLWLNMSLVHKSFLFLSDLKVESWWSEGVLLFDRVPDYTDIERVNSSK